ncbi:hypothetical protein [Rhodococcus opacus]|uniref:hypothetical protein n=1 Tax=Rhodococcus opacus TaxID=37919 RepID=UPI0005C181F0|nr:hypothetical protein [Rhodococcus opacus]
MTTMFDESLSDQDDYVERRWEYNEWLMTLTKPQLINVINRMIDLADHEKFPLIPEENELQEIIELLTEEQEDEE